jgi:hypothetical protein
VCDVAGVGIIGVRLEVVAIVMDESASGVVYLTIVDSVGVVAVMVATVPAVINSSFHILSFKFVVPYKFVIIAFSHYRHDSA